MYTACLSSRTLCLEIANQLNCITNLSKLDRNIVSALDVVLLLVPEVGCLTAIKI